MQKEDVWFYAAEQQTVTIEDLKKKFPDATEKFLKEAMEEVSGVSNKTGFLFLRGNAGFHLRKMPKVKRVHFTLDGKHGSSTVLRFFVANRKKWWTVEQIIKGTSIDKSTVHTLVSVGMKLDPPLFKKKKGVLLYNNTRKTTVYRLSTAYPRDAFPFVLGLVDNKVAFVHGAGTMPRKSEQSYRVTLKLNGSSDFARVLRYLRNIYPDSASAEEIEAASGVSRRSVWTMASYANSVDPPIITKPWGDEVPVRYLWGRYPVSAFPRRFNTVTGDLISGPKITKDDLDPSGQKQPGLFDRERIKELDAAICGPEAPPQAPPQEKFVDIQIVEVKSSNNTFIVPVKFLMRGVDQDQIKPLIESMMENSVATLLNVWTDGEDRLPTGFSIQFQVGNPRSPEPEEVTVKVVFT